MKKLILSVLVLLGMLSFNKAYAEDDNRNVGDQHTYKVDADDAGNDLSWAITTGPVGGAQLIGVTDTESIDILWKLPGSYTISFTEMITHGLLECSTTRTFTVLVSDNLDVTVADGTSTCGTSESGFTPIDFVVTKAIGDQNWSFNYTTSGLSPEVTGTKNIIDGTDNVTVTIPVPNTAGVDKPFTLVINTVADEYGNTEKGITRDNNETAAVSVYGLPATGNISAN